jgi:hypothetical protein
MSNQRPTALDVRALEASTRLTREAGILAGRLAQLLSVSLPQGDDGPVNEGRIFLQAMFEKVAQAQPLSSWSRNPLDRRPRDQSQPLDLLGERLKLSGAEVELLLLAGLAEEHEGLAAVLRTLHPRNEPRVTVGLAAQLLCDDQLDRQAFRTMVETSVVVRCGAVRVTGDGPFFERSLQLADALWPALHGIDVWPAAVMRQAGPVASAGLDGWFSSEAARRAIAAIRQGEACTVVIIADSEEQAFNRAIALVVQAGAEPAGIVLPPVAEPDLQNLIQVHALVRLVVPVLKLTTAEGQSSTRLWSLTSFPGVLVACGRSSEAFARGGRPLLAVPVERLLPMARRRMWREAIPAMAGHAPLLAARYPVEPSIATAVAADLNFVGKLENREPTIADVATSIRAQNSISLSAGVKLMSARATWNDLVLPADRLKQLREAAARLERQAQVFDEWGFLRDRHGARGVRLLFTGPPGTGKTLAAEVLAHTLNVDLLVVDLSRVVSKWIGETERNLSAVFDAAENGQAALFFDEADALFGKRTEVSDAHDRYANLETAYLLTRLEQFEGLAILATNLRQNIDAAFLRRLEFVVDFEEPDREERFALWRCHLPPEAPLAADVNLYELAALYPVVGGVIRNAAVAAGFLAATDETAIDRQHLVHAIRREYLKAGRSFPGAPIGMIPG